ncbi:hypothetical protein [Gordonia terrae]|uniref:hypothetical protein n=1 Tax=Gordonia terrae TaxID=2055 RepID=UPI001269566B|nr:hypothetical protein [Gordonia terrae]
MSEKLSVDPADLRYGGHQLGGWHDETTDVLHGGFRTVGEAADAGWVGASARALEEKLGALQSSARNITTRLGDDSARFVAAARRYEVDETILGAEIAGADHKHSPPVEPQGRILNL